MTLFKFTVYRDSWYRGKGWYDTTLYGKYAGSNDRACDQGCCLGHALDDLGIGTDITDGMGDVEEVNSHLNIAHDTNLKDSMPAFAALLRAEKRAIEVNDDEKTSDEEKEERLRKIFKNEDIEVEFKDGKRSWRSESQIAI